MEPLTVILIIILIVSLLFVLATILLPQFRGRVMGPRSTRIDVEGQRGQLDVMTQDEALVEHDTTGGRAGVEVETGADDDVSARVGEPRDAEAEEDPKA